MAKRNTGLGLGKNNKSSSHKTKKRLEIKKAMLAEKTAKRKKRK